MKFYIITKNVDFLSTQNQLLGQWADEPIVINLSSVEVEEYCISRGLVFYNLPDINYGDALNWTKNIIDITNDYAILNDKVFITQDIVFSRYETEIISRFKSYNDTPYMDPDFILCEKGVDLSDVDFSILPYGIDTNKKINEYTVDWITNDTYNDNIKTYNLSDNLIAFKYYGDSINEVWYFLRKLGLWI